MAESPEKCYRSHNLLQSKTSRSKKSLQIYRLSPKKLTDRTTRKWDGGYYSEKLKQNYLILTKLKPYFQLEKVLNGAFTIAQKLYGLTFTEVFDIDKYHPEVMTYEVTDDKRFSGCFLCRFLSSKREAQRCMDDFV
jgi:peptidyl-dipeptidase Dcp